MKVLFFLMLAAAAPAVGRATTPTAPVTAVPSVTTVSESERTVQDKRIADATVALAQMTSFLALATTAAVTVPLFVGFLSRRRTRRVARGQLRQILKLFMDRTSYLNSFPESDARSLLYGLDTALTRALADDIGDALARDDADIIYNALFSAHGAIARAINQQRQAKEDPMLSGSIQASIEEDTGVGCKDLDAARILLDQLQ